MTRPIVCASGLSPSGPIHLGNLREVMVPHFVADEIARRGIAVEHIISWDDYDRFRKVPEAVEGVDESWNEHVGKPLSSVPAPAGSGYPNWAEHFKAVMKAALEMLASPTAASARRSSTPPVPTASRCCTRCASATGSTRCSGGTAPG